MYTLLQCPYVCFYSIIICSQNLLPEPAVPVQVLGVNICAETTGTGSHCRLQHWPGKVSSVSHGHTTTTVAVTFITASLASVSWTAPRHVHEMLRPTAQRVCCPLPATFGGVASTWHMWCLECLLCSHTCSIVPSAFLTKHKFNDKIITNPKMVTAAHNPESDPSEGRLYKSHAHRASITLFFEFSRGPLTSFIVSFAARPRGSALKNCTEMNRFAWVSSIRSFARGHPAKVFVLLDSLGPNVRLPSFDFPIYPLPNKTLP